MRPPLIDNVVNNGVSKQYMDNGYYIAKPHGPCGIYGFYVRCKHAWLVLSGKASAIHYKEEL